MYSYSARSNLEIRGNRSDTGVWYTADTGRLVTLSLPTGPSAGNAVSTFLWGMHYGDLGDSLLYRIFVSCFGIAVAALSVTGVIVWWQKRQARRRSRFHATSERAVTVPRG